MKYRKKPVTIEAIKWTGDNIDEAIGFIADGHTRFLKYDRQANRLERFVF